MDDGVREEYGLVIQELEGRECDDNCGGMVNNNEEDEREDCPEVFRQDTQETWVSRRLSCTTSTSRYPTLEGKHCGQGGVNSGKDPIFIGRSFMELS